MDTLTAAREAKAAADSSLAAANANVAAVEAKLQELEVRFGSRLCERVDGLGVDDQKGGMATRGVHPSSRHSSDPLSGALRGGHGGEGQGGGGGGGVHGAPWAGGAARERAEHGERAVGGGGDAAEGE